MALIVVDRKRERESRRGSGRDGDIEGLGREEDESMGMKIVSLETAVRDS